MVSGVHFSGEEGLYGSELDWLLTAVSVVENSRGALSHRRRNVGSERSIHFGEFAAGAYISYMNLGIGQS